MGKRLSMAEQSESVVAAMKSGAATRPEIAQKAFGASNVAAKGRVQKALLTLQSAGKVKRDGRGSYKLTAKGAA